MPKQLGTSLLFKAGFWYTQPLYYAKTYDFDNLNDKKFWYTQPLYYAKTQTQQFFYAFQVLVYATIILCQNQ